jgi:hypothetical protein
MARKSVVDTDALLRLNPRFAEAFVRSEDWALKHMRTVESLNAAEPEGFRRPFDGTPRKWCGAACDSEEGCVVCTLSENPDLARENRKRQRQSEPTLRAMRERGKSRK